jgi:thiol:disulfide interchange protein DsbD
LARTLLLAMIGIGPAAGAAGVELLPPEQAFRLSARALDDRTLEARFAIADGYYLYRDKVGFALVPGGPALGIAEMPAGKAKHDQFFGDVETYRGTVVVRLPVSGTVPGQAVELTADSQGCADVGVCYPPTRQKLTLSIPASGKGAGPLVDANPPKKNWFQ